MQKWLIRLSVFAIMVPSAWPQASTGTVSGTVRDQSGAVIPTIEVAIANTATNVNSTTRTNEAGFYYFQSLVPGSYRLTVEAPGMQKYEGVLTVQVGYSVAVDPVLKPAQASTSVEVLDITPLVTTNNATLRDTVDPARISQLPINGRTLNALVTILPGDESHRNFGSPGPAQEWIVDGSVVTDRRWDMALYAGIAGMGAVQEFTLDSNAVSAKHSRPSNVFVSTKSGTNQIHGTAYETLRNNGIGLARARTDYYTKAPELIRNEFGVNMGGPVYIPKVYNGKNRTFWFLNYEGAYRASATTRSFEVPTIAMRNGDFSGLVDSQGRLQVLYDPLSTGAAPNYQRTPFIGNQIPATRESPTAKYLFAITPLPTNSVNPLVSFNWFGAQKGYAPDWTYTARIDHRFSERDLIYFSGHWNYNPSINFSNSYPAPPALLQVPGWKFTLDAEKALAASWMHTLSPAFFSELIVAGRYRIGGGYLGAAATADEQHGAYQTDWFAQLGMPNPFGVKDWPEFPSAGIGLGNYAVQGPGCDRANETYLTLDENLTRIVGKHEFQFGVHYREDLMNIHANDNAQSVFGFNTMGTALYSPQASTASNPQPTPQTGAMIANMYLGDATYQASLLPKWYYLRGGEAALYFQDNYKVTSRLTLNLGLRWEYWRAYKDKNNVMIGFDPANHAMVLGTDLNTMYRLGASIPSVVAAYQALGLKFESWQDAGVPQAMTKNRDKNLGPRFGFAYRALDGNKSFVVRGGYSLAYFSLDQNSLVTNFNNNTPLTATFNYNPLDASQSPNGLPNYGLISVPTYTMGVNSQTGVLDLSHPRGVTAGTASANYFVPDMPTSRIHSWNLTLEKQVAATVARARYVGNHTSHLSQWYSYNQTTPDYIWYATTGQPLPTGTYANVATRPFDQQVLGTIQELRNSGWANTQAIDFELERRFHKGYGYQLSYVMSNSLSTAFASQTYPVVAATNQFMPGAVPTDYTQRDAFLNYQRDAAIPKHRVQ